MGILSTIGEQLGGLFGASTEEVDKARQELGNALSSGTLHAAADYGAQGQALQARAHALGATNVGLDYSAPEADDARLAAIRQHYQDQFRNGGLEGKAAVQAAQNDRGLNAQGGMAGIRQDTLRSGDAQAQVAQTAQNEMNAAGDQANNLDQQKAAIALKKAVLAAQVSHANLLKNLSVNQTSFDLNNSQQALFNDVQGSLNDLNNQTTLTDIRQQQQEAAIGKQIGTALASAGAGLGSTAVSAFGQPAAAQPAGTGVVATSPAQVAPSADGVGAGYVTPTPSVGRTAVPIFQTQPTLPNTAAFFNRGG